MGNEEPSMTEAFMGLSENVDAAISFITGVREKLEKAGFSPTASETMAMSMWHASMNTSGQTS